MFPYIFTYMCVCVCAYLCMCVCVRTHAKSLQSCLSLCHPMDCSLPSSFVHWILQARILEWVAMSSSRGSSPPRDQTHVFYVSCIDRWVLYHCCCCCCKVASVVSNSVWPHRRQPTRLPRLWDSPGRNTGVGCHFLLQCMKVKSESEVAQLCPTLADPIDCGPPDSSVHGIFQTRFFTTSATKSIIFYILSLNVCNVICQLCLNKAGEKRLWERTSSNRHKIKLKEPEINLPTSAGS